MMHLLSLVLATSVWLPGEGSVGAGEHDFLFRVLLLVGGTILALFILAIDFVLLANLRKGDHEVGRPVAASRGNVVLLNVVMAAVVIAIWTGGMRASIDAAVAPADVFAVEATLADGGWTFTYPNTATADTLHLPQGRAAQLAVHSDDLARRVHVPAFRLSGVARPGEAHSSWVRPADAGSYALFATRLDGGRADSLSTELLVEEPAVFDAWLAKISDPLQMYPLPQAGRVLVERNGCLVCHSVDGSRLTGPSFLGLLSRTRDFEGGGSAAADSFYVAESILQPQARIVAGYQSVMPAFAGKLGDPEIGAVLAFLRSLEPGEESR
jgi:cytochrome c oxidase subunit 2